MTLAKTNLSPEDQVRSMITYDDQLAAGSGLETGATTLNDDMSSVFSQINRLINSTTAGNNWYDALVPPATFEGGTVRGTNDMNLALHNVERQRVLKRTTLVGSMLGVSTNASGTLTGTGNFSDTETVTVGVKTYTFQATLTNVDGNVQVGADLATSLLNLEQAVNLDPAGSGTAYAAATTVHPTVTAVSSATTLVATAKNAGTLGNFIATTTTAALASWSGAQLSGGGAVTDVLLVSPEFIPTFSTVAAVGAVDTLGVVTASAGTYGTADLSTVASSNAIQPKNMVLLFNASDGSLLTRTGGVADGKQVFGIFQAEPSVSDGDTITGYNGGRVQISLVVVNAAGTGIELVTAGDVPATSTVGYVYALREALQDCQEDAWVQAYFVGGGTGAATATRQEVYNNNPDVLTLANATLDVGAGLSWEIGDASSASLLTVVEGNGTGSTSLTVGADVDTYANDALVVTFDNGIAVDNGSNAIHIGNASSGSDTIAFTSAGTLTSSSSNSVTVTADAADVVLSTTTSGNVTLSAADSGGASGGSVNLNGGDSGATLTGGAVSLTAGVGGATDGTGGPVQVGAGMGGGTNGAGGGLTMSAGVAVGSGTGGAVAVNGGLGGATGTGGGVNITSGFGGSTSGTSGAVVIASGTSTDGDTGQVTLRVANASGTNRTASDMLLQGGSATGNGSGSTISLEAGAGSGAGSSGGSVTVTAGSGGAGTGGDITLTSRSGTTATGSITFRTDSTADVSESDSVVALQNQGTGTGGGSSVGQYVIESDPSVGGIAADVGSVAFRNVAGAGTTGEIWLKTGAAATDWSELSSGNLVSRNFFQDTITGASIAPGGALTGASFTGGVIAVKPSTGFSFDIDAEIYLNGILLMNGAGNEVSNGTGNQIDVAAGGPTFRAGDVVTIKYHTNSTNNTI